ncbi:MAG: hypothetical protein JO336_06720 [Acidobacteriia bacterium]|nr:hypothetical protein [Terriglobia bacterium]MBV9746085.1 hypothetical protein [Terriglobia bacterium]
MQRDSSARLRCLITSGARCGKHRSKRFAENIERNCIHGSDAPETAQTELRFFFSAAELV